MIRFCFERDAIPDGYVVDAQGRRWATYKPGEVRMIVEGEGGMNQDWEDLTEDSRKAVRERILKWRRIGMKMGVDILDQKIGEELLRRSCEYIEESFIEHLRISLVGHKAIPSDTVKIETTSSSPEPDEPTILSHPRKGTGNG